MENKNGGKPTSRSSSRSFRRQNRQDALICSHWVHCACLMARWWKDVERFGVWLVTVVTVKHVMFHKMFLGNVGWNTTVPPGPWGRTYSAWTNTSWWPRQMLSDTASPSFQSTFRALQRSEAKSSRSLFDFFDPLVSNVFAMQIATDRTNETDWNSQSEVNQKSTLNEFKTLQSLHCSVSIESATAATAATAATSPSHCRDVSLVRVENQWPYWRFRTKHISASALIPQRSVDTLNICKHM